MFTDLNVNEQNTHARTRRYTRSRYNFSCKFIITFQCLYLPMNKKKGIFKITSKRKEFHYKLKGNKR